MNYSFFVGVLFLSFLNVVMSQSTFYLSCSDRNTCFDCASNSSCQWCLNYDTCVLRGSETCSPCDLRCTNCITTDPSICVKNYGKCSDFDTCSDCVKNKFCGWNYMGGEHGVTEGKCYPGDANGACFKSSNTHCDGYASKGHLSWQYGENAICPDPDVSWCKIYSECSTCVVDEVCGWNVELMKCVPGNKYGSCYQSFDTRCSGSPTGSWQYGSSSICPVRSSCSDYEVCSTCVKDEACGWNVFQKLCTEGDSLGACDTDYNKACTGSAFKDSLYWQFGESAICPMVEQCSDYTKCSTCVKDAGCGWNTFQAICTEGSERGACDADEDKPCLGKGSKDPMLYWQYGKLASCPRNPDSECMRNGDCNDCTRDPACGWSFHQQTCQEGNVYGACQANQYDTKCPGLSACPKPFNWQYGNMSVCPANGLFCSQYSYCGDCAKDVACVWNMMEGNCYPGNSYGSCDQTNVCDGRSGKAFTFQYYTNATCYEYYKGCQVYNDCGSCISDDACGWNGHKQECYLGNINGACDSSNDPPQSSEWYHKPNSCPQK